MTTPISDTHAAHAPSARYDTQPTIALPAGEKILRGDDGWLAAARVATERSGPSAAPVLLVDTYPGADADAVVRLATRALPDWRVVDVEEAARPADEVDRLIRPNLTDDRVFGVMSHFTIADFYDAEALDRMATDIVRTARPTIVIGWGAAQLGARLDQPSATVLVDMARWELQLRQRAGATNWRADNAEEDALRKYKRGYFVEWRAADRHKRTLFDALDFLLDGNAVSPAVPRSDAPEPGMITGSAFRESLRRATDRPFRVVPFFDPGVWGGQWMKEVIGLDPSKDNYAWCFDCVPEENSLLIEDEHGVIEIPALDLVLTQPTGLLGEKNVSRFGAEFPIRFDFLDTMGGGNLSLQVHPLTDYIRHVFGMNYTQDESYYVLDADDEALVYLGTKTGIDPDEMVADLERAQEGGAPFPVDAYINSFPARKHDHFAIPAGTVHCSGSNTMVLEISATPNTFTFKLWDWGRVGLDGVPRPVHVDHGAKNIQWDRDTEWVEDNLVGRVDTIRENGDVTEERTGLHELEFIEVRRHWFSSAADHDTENTVNVLNLVEGDEVRVVSPTGAFEPFVVHYAETFIVPAAVGAYRIERTETSQSERFATVKAYVRGSRSSDE